MDTENTAVEIDEKDRCIDSSIEETKTRNNVRFTYDIPFQEKILQAMIDKPSWASQLNEVLKIEYFESTAHQIIAKQYIDYYNLYKEFPSLELLATLVQEELKVTDRGELFLPPIKRFFKNVKDNKNLNDLPYVRDQALNFCKRARLQEALRKAVKFVDAEENHDRIIEEVKKAVIAGNDHSPGLSLHDDIEARYSETYRKAIPTGIPTLDQKLILDGGLGIGEIGFVVAPTGVGKSHMLVQFAANAVKQGKNVVYYSFELNERLIGLRVDSNILNIPSSELFEHKEKVKYHYKQNATRYGQLHIKYYPTGTSTVNTIRSHLEKLSVAGFKPDLLVIDYAGVMRSTERSDLLRIELKKICEELRALAAELEVPIWTALQANREAADVDIVTMSHVAESYGMAAVADLVIGLARPTKLKSSGLGFLHIDKNRMGADGMTFNIHLDTSTSTLKVTDSYDIDSAIDDKEDEAYSIVRKAARNIGAI